MSKNQLLNLIKRQSLINIVNTRNIRSRSTKKMKFIVMAETELAAIWKESDLSTVKALSPKAAKPILTASLLTSILSKQTPLNPTKNNALYLQLKPSIQNANKIYSININLNIKQIQVSMNAKRNYKININSAIISKL